MSKKSSLLCLLLNITVVSGVFLYFSCSMMKGYWIIAVIVILTITSAASTYNTGGKISVVTMSLNIIICLFLLTNINVYGDTFIYKITKCYFRILLQCKSHTVYCFKIGVKSLEKAVCSSSSMEIQLTRFTFTTPTMFMFESVGYC